MRALVLWSLHTSEAISTIIKNSYTSSRAEDDKNHALAVQPWGRDGDRRRYWLIEGRDDTDFRIYRESNPALEPITWQSVGGSIDELKDLARKLKEEDGSQAATRLGERILGAVPRFEASDEVIETELFFCDFVKLIMTETKTSRISPLAQGSIYQTRAWLFQL